MTRQFYLNCLNLRISAAPRGFYSISHGSSTIVTLPVNGARTNEAKWAAAATAIEEMDDSTVQIYARTIRAALADAAGI